MASLVIYISSYPARPQRITVKYDHLTPRLQELLFESKKYKNANNFKFCWAKNGAVCLRKRKHQQS